jgi:hypothetical protein
VPRFAFRSDIKFQTLCLGSPSWVTLSSALAVLNAGAMTEAVNRLQTSARISERRDPCGARWIIPRSGGVNVRRGQRSTWSATRSTGSRDDLGRTRRASSAVVGLSV